jgi:hypothetical protein
VAVVILHITYARIMKIDYTRIELPKPGIFYLNHSVKLSAVRQVDRSEDGRAT